MIQLTASAFGKLPVTGDFIKQDAFGAHLSWLDRWLQEGIAHTQDRLGAAWTAPYDDAAPACFLRRGGNEFMTGVVVPGVDTVGRRFPFTIYTVAAARALAKRPALVPFLVAEFLEAAEEFAVEGWEGLDLVALRERVADLSRRSDEKAARAQLEAHLQQRTVPELWERWWDSADDPRRFLLLSNAVALLGRRSNPAFVLRVPGGDVADAALWLEVAATLRGASPALALWNPGNHERGLRLLLGDPTAEQYAQLFLAGQEGQEVCDMGQEGLESERMLSRARDTFQALADDRVLPLAGLVRALSKHT